MIVVRNIKEKTLGKKREIENEVWVLVESSS